MLGIILCDSFTLFIQTINPVFPVLTNVTSELAWGIPCLPSEDGIGLPIVYLQGSGNQSSGPHIRMARALTSKKKNADLSVISFLLSALDHHSLGCYQGMFHFRPSMLQASLTSKCAVSHSWSTGLPPTVPMPVQMVTTQIGSLHRGQQCQRLQPSEKSHLQKILIQFICGSFPFLYAGISKRVRI